ncbi:MAG: GH32 C-terminal domain-containing protein [Planctomycetota bacterium]|jgi:fructan beta-fructosidase
MVNSAFCGDLLIADFEAKSYEDWEVEGEAFGREPATGALPDQDDVSGFEGQGLVNSFLGGDEATGTMTSPEFKIERKFMNFLIGGGGSRRTRIELLFEGKVVRMGSGMESELLYWENWDVSELIGKNAQIRIVDRGRGDWGHILVDHIYQSNTHRGAKPKSRQLTFQNKYLNFPVKRNARERLVSVIIDGEKVREFSIRLAHDEPDYWVYLEIGEFKGKQAIVNINKYDAQSTKGFDMVFQADSFPGEEDLYKEKLRPQFHFTSKRGWNNDTNGMVYYDGEYHMFYQHNPFGWPWGNMTWGHAISTDMIHWKELGDAIHPDKLGTIFSGGAVVDHKNTSGFQTGDDKPIVCFYTSAGGENPWSKDQPFTQSIAYSNDKGRTFTKYEDNPIIGHIRGGNRDPKVIWHEPTNKWVMVLYVEEGEMDFFTSSDLKTWTKTSKLGSFHECPELFELPVDGDENNKKWVLYGAAGDYFVGTFDGKEFKPESKGITFDYGNAFYASQTFSDIPEEDGRRIMMGWGQVSMPEMPWNQMITFPVVLTLRTTDEGIRMFAEPVEEVEKLHKKKHSFSNETIDGTKTLSGIDGELFHIKAELEVGDADSFGLIIREYNITYEPEENRIICTGPESDIDTERYEDVERFSEPHDAPLEPVDGKIILEILVDRTMVEVFPNNGRYYFPMGAYLVDRDPAIGVFSKGGKTKLNKLEIFELKSIWH